MNQTNFYILNSGEPDLSKEISDLTISDYNKFSEREIISNLGKNIFGDQKVKFRNIISETEKNSYMVARFFAEEYKKYSCNSPFVVTNNFKLSDSLKKESNKFIGLYEYLMSTHGYAWVPLSISSGTEANYCIVLNTDLMETLLFAISSRNGFRKAKKYDYMILSVTDDVNKGIDINIKKYFENQK